MRRATAALCSVLALVGLHGTASAMNGMAGMSGMGATTINVYSGQPGMGGMSGMSGMGGMAGMGGMSGMSGMSGMGGMAGMSGMAAQAIPRQKVVYHINGDDPAQQSQALGNIQNHINAVGKDNLDLKVVLHGDGLSLLLYPDAKGKTKMKQANATDEVQAKLTGLKGQGVQFQVCGNTLKGRNVEVKDLYDVNQGDVVPSGVAQLGILQSQGYAYIKP
jgi:intracellular sulfur oxidation DsrE/DsrF family protein